MPARAFIVTAIAGVFAGTGKGGNDGSWKRVAQFLSLCLESIEKVYAYIGIYR